jgi:hypothetical protein
VYIQIDKFGKKFEDIYWEIKDGLVTSRNICEFGCLSKILLYYQFYQLYFQKIGN